MSDSLKYNKALMAVNLLEKLIQFETPPPMNQGAMARGGPGGGGMRRSMSMGNFQQNRMYDNFGGPGGPGMHREFGPMGGPGGRFGSPGPYG